jgi:hypothetical protein
MNDAVNLALTLKRDKYAPEQVQDYYPTPGTASTVMYYTGINPLNMKPVYVATDYHEKQLQRALLQWGNPKNADLVREALIKCQREDLIGYGKECLVKPSSGKSGFSNQKQSKQYKNTGADVKKGKISSTDIKKDKRTGSKLKTSLNSGVKKPFERKKDWAKPKKKK